MKLEKITRVAPRTEALMRVYKDRIVLNAYASALLDLAADSQIMVWVDADSMRVGRKRLYVGCVDSNGYKVRQRNSTHIVCSTELAKSTAGGLDGYGTYRICPEDYTHDTEGAKYYSIFFKRYD